MNQIGPIEYCQQLIALWRTENSSYNLTVLKAVPSNSHKINKRHSSSVLVASSHISCCMFQEYLNCRNDSRNAAQIILQYAVWSLVACLELGQTS